MIDGAHNPVSIRALIKAIGAHIPYDSLVMVFGCAADKEVLKLLREVNLGADKVIFTKAKGNPRASDPAELLRDFHEISDKMAQAADNLPAAVGDVAFIEVSDAQVKQAQVDADGSTSLRYLSLVVNGVAAETVHVMAELGRAQCEEEGLTVDIIA